MWDMNDYVFDNELKIISLHCEHYFCSECWIKYLKEKILNGEVIYQYNLMRSIILND